MAEPIRVDVGDQILEFPAGMTQDEIQNILRQKYPPAQATPQPTPTRMQTAIPEGVDPDVVGLTSALGGQAAIDEMYELSAPVREAQRAAKDQTFGENVVGSLPMAGQMFGSLGGIAITKSPKGAVIGGGAGYGMGENLRQAITGESRINEMLIGVGLASTTEALAAPIAKLLQKGIEITPAILKSFAPTLSDADSLKIIGELSKPFFLRGKKKIETEDSIRLLETLSDETGQAGLTPSQVQQSWVANLQEALGRAGIGGQEMFDALKATNERVLQNWFRGVTSKLENGSMTPDEVGLAFYQFIEDGNKALGTAYRAEEAKFLQATTGIPVSIARTRAKALGLQREGSAAFDVDELGRPLDTALSTQVLSVIQKIKNVSADASPREIDTLIKLLSETQTEASTTLGKTSPTTQKITELLNTLRKDLKDSLPSNLKKQYEQMKNSYAASKKALFPSALRSAMRFGKQENFEAIGALLQRDSNTTTIRSALNALDEAKRLNPDLNTFEAQRAIQGGFLESRLKAGSATIDEMAKYYDELMSTSVKRNTFMELFGESGKGVIAALKAAKDATADPVKKGPLSLFVASRQLTGAIQLGGAATSIGIDPDNIDNMAVLKASAILLSPYVLAKVATNPQTARQLVKLNKNSPRMSTRAITSATLQILRELNIDPKIVNEQLIEYGLPSLDYTPESD